MNLNRQLKWNRKHPWPLQTAGPCVAVFVVALCACCTSAGSSNPAAPASGRQHALAGNGEEAQTLKTSAATTTEAGRAGRTSDTSGWVPPFAFPEPTNVVEEALTEIWLRAFDSPATPDEAAAARQAIDHAKAVLKAHPDEAAKAVYGALVDLSADDHAAYVSLVAVIEAVDANPKIVDHLHARLMAPLSRAEKEVSDVVAPESLVRATVMQPLKYHARQGNEYARALVLDAVSSPHAPTRAGAVEQVYEFQPDRRRAQQMMRPLMRPEDHYILYTY